MTGTVPKIWAREGGVLRFRPRGGAAERESRGLDTARADSKSNSGPYLPSLACYAGGGRRNGPGYPLHLIYPDALCLEEIRDTPMRVVAKDQRPPEEDVDHVAFAADLDVPVGITDPGRARCFIPAV